TSLEYNQMIQKIILECSPASDKNLLGMLTDVDHYLAQSGIVTSILTRITRQASHLIDAKCESISHPDSWSDVINALENIWRQELSYRSFEAHIIKSNTHEITMDCLTFKTKDGKKVQFN